MKKMWKKSAVHSEPDNDNMDSAPETANTNGDLNKKEESDEKWTMKDTVSFVKTLLVCFVLVMIFTHLIARPVQVEGHSMDPTLKTGDYGFTSVLSLKLSEPKRSEIVVINRTEKDGSVSRWIKRVIGLPGETIECKDGIVYIDGQPLDESAYLSQDYIDTSMAYFEETYGYTEGNFTFNFGPVTLENDEFFVMGDNRPFSKDSRYPDVGPVKKDALFGTGIMVLFPFSQIGIY